MAIDATSLSAIRELLAEAVDSYEKLEIVICLHNARVTALTCTALAEAISLPEPTVAEALSELLRQGLVTTLNQGEGGWRLDANDTKLRTVAALAERYAEDRMEILTLMSELAFERIRAKTAQRFADAFLVRLKKKGEPDA